MLPPHFVARGERQIDRAQDSGRLRLGNEESGMDDLKEGPVS